MTLYYDFHIHSALSPCADNDMTPCNIVNMARFKGLDAIAVTDHNSAKNARAVMSAGGKTGIKVIAGMEIETAEEVHVLSLFPSVFMAEKAEEIVRKNMPFIANNEEIFGKQLVMDEFDNIVSEETQLLMCATFLTIEEVYDLVRDCGGVPIAAHVDRGSFSVMSNLGFMPDEINASAIEISSMTDVHEYLRNNPDLKKYKVIRNSDAHNLGAVSERINSIELSNKNTSEILSIFI